MDFVITFFEFLLLSVIGTTSRTIMRFKTMVLKSYSGFKLHHVISYTKINSFKWNKLALPINKDKQDVVEWVMRSRPYNTTFKATNTTLLLKQPIVQEALFWFWGGSNREDHLNLEIT